MQAAHGWEGGGDGYAGGGAVGSTGFGRAFGSGEAMACCGGLLGSDTKKSSPITYVGDGGSYVLETTYRYVGPGAGEFDVPEKPSRWPLCFGGCVFVAAAALTALGLLGFISVPMLSTTTALQLRPAVGPSRDCLLWGDAHAQTFDGGFQHFTATGEYWIVKSDFLEIRGRFDPTTSTEGLPALTALSIRGKTLGSHDLQVFSLEHGFVMCDGEPVLDDFPSSGSCGPVKLKYDGLGQNIDSSLEELDKHVLHVDLPAVGVHLQILRWANHINVKITMKRRGDQDGLCGNFDSSSDGVTAEQLVARSGGRIPADEVVFKHQTEAHGEVVKTVEDCEPAKRQLATEKCKQGGQTEQPDLLASCIFDVCFGGVQYALQDVISEGQARVP